MKSILDPSFRYTKAIETDLRKTFARVRRERAKDEAGKAAAAVAAAAAPLASVTSLRTKAAAT